MSAFNYSLTKNFSHIVQNQKKNIKLVLLLFPLFVIFFTFLLKSYSFWWYKILMLKEDSVTENLTFFLYFISFIVSFSLAATYHKRKSYLFGAMYFILAMSFFFIAMEEISWGQRILNISTPQAFSNNYQHEMNFHNFRTFPLHTLYIIIGLYGAFSRALIPKKIMVRYRSIVDLFTPNYFLFFYFFIVAFLYLYYEYLSSIGVIFFGEGFGWGEGRFMHGKDQEPAELLLAFGFFFFVSINKYRQLYDRDRSILIKPDVSEKPLK